MRRKSSTLNGYLHEALAGMRGHQGLRKGEEKRTAPSSARPTTISTAPGWRTGAHQQLVLAQPEHGLRHRHGAGCTCSAWPAGSTSGRKITMGTLLIVHEFNYLGRSWEPLNNMTNF